MGREIQAALGAQAGEHFFPLPYDWRRFNQVSARILKQRTNAWLVDALANGVRKGPRGDGTVPRMSATPPESGNQRLEVWHSVANAGSGVLLILLAAYLHFWS